MKHVMRLLFAAVCASIASAQLSKPGANTTGIFIGQNGRIPDGGSVGTGGRVPGDTGAGGIDRVPVDTGSGGSCRSMECGDRCGTGGRDGTISLTVLSFCQSDGSCSPSRPECPTRTRAPDDDTDARDACRNMECGARCDVPGRRDGLSAPVTTPVLSFCQSDGSCGMSRPTCFTEVEAPACQQSHGEGCCTFYHGERGHDQRPVNYRDGQVFRENCPEGTVGNYGDMWQCRDGELQQTGSGVCQREGGDEGDEGSCQLSDRSMLSTTTDVGQRMCGSYRTFEECYHQGMGRCTWRTGETGPSPRPSEAGPSEGSCGLSDAGRQRGADVGRCDNFPSRDLCELYGGDFCAWGGAADGGAAGACELHEEGRAMGASEGRCTLWTDEEQCQEMSRFCRWVADEPNEEPTEGCRLHEAGRQMGASEGRCTLWQSREQCDLYANMCEWVAPQNPDACSTERHSMNPAGCTCLIGGRMPYGCHDGLECRITHPGAPEVDLPHRGVCDEPGSSSGTCESITDYRTCAQTEGCQFDRESGCQDESDGCQPVLCEMYCESGWAVGDDGCEVCRCAEEEPRECPCGETCTRGRSSGTCQTDNRTCAQNIVPPRCDDVEPERCPCGETCTRGQSSGTCQTDNRTCAQNIVPPNCGTEGEGEGCSGADFNVRRMFRHGESALNECDDVIGNQHPQYRARCNDGEWINWEFSMDGEEWQRGQCPTGGPTRDPVEMDCSNVDTYSDWEPRKMKWCCQQESVCGPDVGGTSECDVINTLRASEDVRERRCNSIEGCDYQEGQCVEVTEQTCDYQCEGQCTSEAHRERLCNALDGCHYQEGQCVEVAEQTCASVNFLRASEAAREQLCNSLDGCDYQEGQCVEEAEEPTCDSVNMSMANEQVKEARCEALRNCSYVSGRCVEGAGCQGGECPARSACEARCAQSPCCSHCDETASGQYQMVMQDCPRPPVCPNGREARPAPGQCCATPNDCEPARDGGEECRARCERSPCCADCQESASGQWNEIMQDCARPPICPNGEEARPAPGACCATPDDCESGAETCDAINMSMANERVKETRCEALENCSYVSGRCVEDRDVNEQNEECTRRCEDMPCCETCMNGQMIIRDCAAPPRCPNGQTARPAPGQCCAGPDDCPTEDNPCAAIDGRPCDTVCDNPGRECYGRADNPDEECQCPGLQGYDCTAWQGAQPTQKRLKKLRKNVGKAEKKVTGATRKLTKAQRQGNERKISKAQRKVDSTNEAVTEAQAELAAAEEFVTNCT